MQKINLIFLILCFLLLPFYLFANGGVIDYSHFRKTGNIKLLRKADVSLLKEDLFLKVVGDYTEIEVHYQLKNNGEQQKMLYGFPIDAYRISMSGDTDSNEKTIFAHINYFYAYDNDAELKPINWVADSVYSVKTSPKSNYYEYDKTYCIISRKWYVLDIAFEKDEIKTLKIKYKVKNALQDHQSGFSFISEYSERKFTYHLTPSSTWGDGIVKEFNLKIDLTNLDSIKADYEITGIDSLPENQHIHSFFQKDYDLNKSDRIEIVYDNKHLKYANFIEKGSLPNKIIKSIRASTNSAKAKNLIDGSALTSWTGKKGDWIEIEFKPLRKSYYLEGILLLHGDYSSEENFNKSGKLNTLKVILNDSIHYNNHDEISKLPVIMEKPIYKNIDANLMKGLSCRITDGFFDRYGILKIRFEILKTTKKEVTLSEIYFIGYKRREE